MLRRVGVKWYRDSRWLQILAISLCIGALLGALLGVSLLLVLPPVSQSPMFPCKYDQNACQVSLSRPLLPFPDRPMCNP